MSFQYRTFQFLKYILNYFNVLEKKNHKIIHKSVYIETQCFPFWLRLSCSSSQCWWSLFFKFWYLVYYGFFQFFSFFFFLPILHCLWDLSSPTRDWTWALGGGNTESQPLDGQGIHSFQFLKILSQNIYHHYWVFWHPLKIAHEVSTSFSSPKSCSCPSFLIICSSIYSQISSAAQRDSEPLPPSQLLRKQLSKPWNDLSLQAVLVA